MEKTVYQNIDVNKSKRDLKINSNRAQINDNLGSVNFKAYGSIVYGTMTGPLTLKFLNE